MKNPMEFSPTGLECWENAMEFPGTQVEFLQTVQGVSGFRDGVLSWGDGVVEKTLRGCAYAS